MDYQLALFIAFCIGMTVGGACALAGVWLGSKR